MKRSVEKSLVRIIVFLNICCVILLLISDLAPLANPVSLWPVAVTGIIFPLLAIGTLLFAVFWLIMDRKKSWYSFLALLISFPNLATTFPFQFSHEFELQKPSNTLRVMSWNVELMGYNTADSVEAIRGNKIIFKEIKQSNADVICLQEFFSSVEPGSHYNLIDSIKKTAGYPYYYFSRDIPKFDEKFFSGSIIFSRYPIIDSAKILFPEGFPGSVIRAGILFNNYPIDVFTSRLQSLKFQSKEYRQLHQIKTGEVKDLESSKNILQKIRASYIEKVDQTLLIKRMIAKSRRPTIYTGDMNDVPISHAYNTVKGEMKDAWKSKGSGLGRTFRYISPTLRIDQVFYSNHFKAAQVKTIITNSSDHYGLVADLDIKK